VLRVAFSTLSALPSLLGEGSEPLVVMPFIEPALAKRSAAQLARRAGCSGLLLAVYDAERVGFVAVANRVFRASRAPLFAYVAQDAFAGRDWLLLGSRALLHQGGGLLGFNDGKWSGSLAAFGLVERSWGAANYDGDLFHPGYRRHYADAELTVLALGASRYRYDPSAVLVEVDWDKEAAAADETDRALFKQRAKGGFDSRIRDDRLLNMIS
jgi:hypothetical protein